MEKLIALKIKCPKCKKSMMDPYHQINGKPSILMDIESDGEIGKIRLCAFYGCYDHEATIELKDKSIVKFSCPSCKEELVSKNVCEACGAPMVPMSMEKGGRIYICSRKGCSEHYINFENVSDALRKMYNEFGYF
jgi:methionyl-tRNA synthetase